MGHTNSSLWNLVESPDVKTNYNNSFYQIQQSCQEEIDSSTILLMFWAFLKKYSENKLTKLNEPTELMATMSENQVEALKRISSIPILFSIK